MDEALANGVDAISIVRDPAIEENFIALNKQQPVKFAKVNEERRIIVGAALIPNLPIYRNIKDEEFYVYFTSETVRRVAHKFIGDGRQSQATIEHAVRIGGVKVVESWVVEDEARDKALTFGIVPKRGTWMVMMRIDNDTIWNDFIKTGEVRGFSIEGFFAEKRISARAQLKRVIS